MRRPVLAVVLSLGLVLLVLGGAYLADGFARDRAQAEVYSRAAAALDEHEGLSVDVRGGLFLPQVARGEVGRVDLTADSVTLQGTTLQDVTLVARDIDLADPVTAGDVVADARVPLAELQERLDAATADSPTPLTLAVEDGSLVAEVDVLPIAAPLGLEPDGAGVLVTLSDVRVGPVTVDAASLAGLLGRETPSIRVDLPLHGLTVDRVEVEDDALRLHVAGRGIAVTGAL